MREIERVRLFNDDCLNVMKDLDSGSVDLVITDVPYGIGYFSNYSKDDEYRNRVKSVGGIINDDPDNISFLQDVAIEVYRVLRDNTHIYWFTRWDKAMQHIKILEQAGFRVKNNLIWAKNNWSMGDLKGAYAGQYENILFAHKGRRLLNTVENKSRHSDILNYDRVPSSRLLHSHQKPVDLLEFFVKKSSEEGEIILDPFMGVGSTGVASTNLNRKFIGIELDEDYFKIAKQRIEVCEREKVRSE